MFLEAKLILQSHMPEIITKGMWFISVKKNKPVLFSITYNLLSNEDYNKFVEINGYPVRPYIYLVGNPNIPGDDELFCTPEQVGWFDVGDESDEMHDITIDEINNILQYDDGMIYIEAEIIDASNEDDEQPEEVLVPTLLEGKCIIRYHGNDEEEEEEEEPPMCFNCNGTGEGSYDGSSCSVCGGKGYTAYQYEGDEEYEPDDNDRWESDSPYYPDIND